MKKTLLVLSFVFVLVAILTVSVFALAANDNGVYEIATADDLIEFRNTANGTGKAYKAVLTADIDMTGKAWEPFTKVIMNFDGQGHTISGLSYTKTDATSYTGLFANEISNGDGMHSTVKNVIFKDCTLNVTMGGGGQEIGIVAGHPDRCAIYDIELKNCDMNIDGTGGETIVGFVAGRDSYEHNDFGTVAVGAKVDADSVITVAETTTFTGESRFGGIVGASNQRITFIRCEPNGQIVGDVRKAPFVSDVWNTAIYCGYTEGAYETMHNRTNDTYYLPYVSTADELLAAVAKINEGNQKLGFYLNADIDMTGKAWTPITIDNWVGIIDGGNHTLSGITLEYTDAAAGNYGLITNKGSNGGGGNGTVANLIIADSSLTVNLVEGANGGTFVGAVMGLADRGHVQNITLKNVDVALTGNPNNEIGVGCAIGKTQYAGPKGHVSVYNVTTDANCSVTVDSGSNNNSYAGGIVGRKGSDSAEFRNLVNFATVSGYNVGGIIGGVWSQNNLFDGCVNYGNLYGSNIVASLIANGEGINGITLRNCVAGGFISGAKDVFADYRNNFEPTIEGLRVVSILNPMGADAEETMNAYYQTADAGEGKINLRVLFLTKFDFADALEGRLNVTVKFTKDGADVKTYEGEFSEVYKTVSAAGDTYIAPSDIVIFGNVFTGVPTDAVNGFTVTVTDADGAVVYTAEGAIG